LFIKKSYLQVFICIAHLSLRPSSEKTRCSVDIVPFSPPVKVPALMQRAGRAGNGPVQDGGPEKQNGKKKKIIFWLSE
jgi:hypothetical protein